MMIDEPVHADEDCDEEQEDEEGDEEDGEEESEEGRDCWIMEVPERMGIPPMRMITPEKPLDAREECVVPMLFHARGCARLCPSRACRAADICQQPPLKCRLRPFADAHDWDHTMPNGPRQKMYEEITQKHLAGCCVAFHFPDEVKKHTPKLPPELLGGAGK